MGAGVVVVGEVVKGREQSCFLLNVHVRSAFEHDAGEYALELVVGSHDVEGSTAAILIQDVDCMLQPLAAKTETVSVLLAIPMFLLLPSQVVFVQIR